MPQPSMKQIHVELHLYIVVVDAASLLISNRELHQSRVECRPSVDECHRCHLVVTTTIDLFLDDALALDLVEHRKKSIIY